MIDQAQLKWLLEHPRTKWAALLALFSVLTSPKAVVELLIILGVKWPLHALSGFLKTVMPWPFMKDVSDDVVLITGGASGIGKLMAQRFATLGSHVIIVDVDPSTLSKALANIQAYAVDPDRIHSVCQDITKRQEVYDAMAKISNTIGDVTILINNAGIVTGKKLLECEDRLMDKTFQVNTVAHFWTVKAVLPSMLANNKGHIVTIASNAGLLGAPGLVDYCASKHGAVGLDEALRLEINKLGKTGVKTLCVCPFFINTGMFEGAHTRWPLLVPMLEPPWVADNIVTSIRTDRPFLILPTIGHLIPVFRAFLPVPVFDEIAVWFGANDVMEKFKGRNTQPSSDSSGGSSKITRG